MTVTAAAETLPKSYLPPEERESLERHGNTNLLYLSESLAAGKAGDDTAAWAWMRFVDMPAQALMSLKRRTSGQFIRDKGLRTAEADALYGAGWLDRP